ncbi:MAG: M18 family aminopeptidase [Nocardioidaceae bacterium]
MNESTDPIVRAGASELCSFIDASPSPFHVCETVAAELDGAGFTRVAEVDAWGAGGRHYAVRGGSLIAWSTEAATGPATPFRVVGGHTDSTNLRVKQHPDIARAGWQLIGLEPYGGAWLNSWLDRDLGLSGRVTVRDGRSTSTRLLTADRPILRVPQLAIHLASDRKSVELDPQRHVDAVWGVGTSAASFAAFVAAEVGADAGDVLGWELMTHAVAPSSLVGRESEFVSAPRLDNQGTCFAGLHALLSAVAAPTPGIIPVLALFDHEEVGSMSDRGAFSDLLATTLERVVLATGGTRDEYLRALAGSVCASGDMAHATHPNYPDRHEPGHRIQVNGGPVLKVNQNLRYASDSTGTATYALACDQAGVPMQRYVHRADLPCGSTVGPITASRTGLSTVDVGAAQLAMHSAREFMGADDVPAYARSLAAFLAPSS